MYTLSVVRLADPSHAVMSMLNVSAGKQSWSVCGSNSTNTSPAVLGPAQPACDPSLPMSVNVSASAEVVLLQPTLLAPGVCSYFCSFSNLSRLQSEIISQISRDRSQCTLAKISFRRKSQQNEVLQETDVPCQFLCHQHMMDMCPHIPSFFLHTLPKFCHTLIQQSCHVMSICSCLKKPMLMVFPIAWARRLVWQDENVSQQLIVNA